jgi:hypothetical protein
LFKFILYFAISEIFIQFISKVLRRNRIQYFNSKIIESYQELPIIYSYLTHVNALNHTEIEQFYDTYVQLTIEKDESKK